MSLDLFLLLYFGVLYVSEDMHRHELIQEVCILFWQCLSILTHQWWTKVYSELTLCYMYTKYKHSRTVLTFMCMYSVDCFGH